VKQENAIGENLSLEKRKIEKSPGRRKNSIELEDSSQDRLRYTAVGKRFQASLFQRFMLVVGGDDFSFF
jgi:hypothetical protein